MNLEKGLVSVIMSNYNTKEEYLRTAIESVLNQSYKKIELIIVDDCSELESLKIIQSYDDKRIVVLKNDKNMGITKSLNRALKIAKGEFVARMDADDICLQQRFEKQVEYLTKHKEVIVCGTWVELFGDGANKYNQTTSCKTLPKREELQIHLLFGNHMNIIHPTAMFRHKSMLENNIMYNEKYIYAQDYRMWIECSRFGECANVPEILLKYRIHDNAVSSNKKHIQDQCTREIIEEQLSWLDLKIPGDWEIIHFAYLVGRKNYDLRQRDWVKQIINANRTHNVFNQRTLEEKLWKKWAETTYFALRTQKNLKLLLNLPFKYWPELVKIRKKRSTNGSE